MQTVRIFSQDLDRVDRKAGQFAFTSDWSLPRKHTFTYYTDKDGEQAAEQAYHIFNAPETMLNEFERHIVSNAREHSHDMHSLSVGDVVRVGDEVEYLCASEGWLSRRFA
jgi:hypothetical protein